MPVSTLTTTFQVTIPRDIRDALGVGVGDQIEFILESDGVRVRCAQAVPSDLRALDGVLASEWMSSQDNAQYADL